jgi:uncharacterized protein (DUF885 family)
MWRCKGAHLALGVLLVVSTMSAAGEPKSPAWVARSNETAKPLLDAIARFNPEAASQFGVESVDDQIMDLKPGYQTRFRAAITEARDKIQAQLASEKDPLVRQDVEILVKAANDQLRGIDIQEKYHLDYFNLGRVIFTSMHSLLDDQVPQERRVKALTRLRRYAGMEPGYEPIVTLAEARTRESVKPGRTGPAKAELEKDLQNSTFFVDGIGQLFEKYKIAGYEEPYAKLKQQVADYNEFLRKEVLPKARADFRLPAEEYEYQLQTVGVDATPEQLVTMAHAAFKDLQAQMQNLAPQVAKQHGIAATDYRDVIRALKKDQLVGDAILPHYQGRLKEIEQIIEREKLVTLPQRPARIRLASAAETAAVPAPHLDPPRLIGNTGEQAAFILPLNIPSQGADAAKLKYDDFTFNAASWTLTAHEARPGHELQFDSMMERGVSTARAVFAFNSTNVEGWGLYAEYILQPFMPADGQLISLQHRLMRTARMFLDPELQMGKVTPEQAKAVLINDVVLSNAMAQQEVERYTFAAPGQATSYYYGYSKLVDLRKEVERQLGPKFNAQRFHDFLLSQGLLPPDLLRKAVLEEFVQRERSAPTSAAH